MTNIDIYHLVGDMHFYKGSCRINFLQLPLCHSLFLHLKFPNLESLEPTKKLSSISSSIFFPTSPTFTLPPKKHTHTSQPWNHPRLTQKKHPHISTWSKSSLEKSTDPTNRDLLVIFMKLFQLLLQGHSSTREVGNTLVSSFGPDLGIFLLQNQGQGFKHGRIFHKQILLSTKKDFILGTWFWDTPPYVAR